MTEAIWFLWNFNSPEWEHLNLIRVVSQWAMDTVVILIRFISLRFVLIFGTMFVKLSGLWSKRIVKLDRFWRKCRKMWLFIQVKVLRSKFKDLYVRKEWNCKWKLNSSEQILLEEKWIFLNSCYSPLSISNKREFIQFICSGSQCASSGKLKTDSIACKYSWNCMMAALINFECSKRIFN